MRLVLKSGGLLISTVLVAACSTTPIPETLTKNLGATESDNPFVPQISLRGANPTRVEVFGSYVELGADAVSLKDGVLNSDQISIFGEVVSDRLGSYKITYVAKDSIGRIGKAERTVNVIDSGVPQIFISHNQDIYFEKLGYGNSNSTPYNDGIPGLNFVSAADNYDGDLSSRITSVSTVDSTKEGDYAITYGVQDSSGNAAAAVSRLVHVRDTKPPGISFGTFSAGIVSQYSAPVTIPLRFEDAARVNEFLPTLISIVPLTGSIQGCQISAGGTSLAERTISISGCEGSGSLALRVGAGAATDDATIPGANATPAIQSNLGGFNQTLQVSNDGPNIQISAGGSILISNTGTAVFNLNLSGNGAFIDNTQIASLISLEFVTGTVTCASKIVEGTNPQMRTVKFSQCQQGTGDPVDGSRVKFKLAAGAAIGSLVIPSAPATSPEFKVDTTAPTITISAPSSTGPLRNAANQSVTLNVTYSEHVSSSGAALLTSSDLQEVVVSGNPHCNLSIEMLTAQEPSIRLSNCSGDGDLRILVKENSVADDAGNFNTLASNTSASVSIDNTAPTLTVTPAAMDLNLCDSSTLYRSQGVDVGQGGSLQVESENVDRLKADTYSIVFKAVDAAGNQSASVTRQIRILPVVREGATFDLGLAASTDFFDSNVPRSLRSSVNAGRTENFLLCNDIDMANFSTSVLGSSSRSFKGIFDGDKHKIQNLAISSTTTGAGLFFKIRGEVRNLILENIVVSGVDETGALASVNSGVIRNLGITGISRVTGRDRTGGLVGNNDIADGNTGSISSSFSLAEVFGDDFVGGLAGESEGSIVDSFVLPRDASSQNINPAQGVNNPTHLGGLVGALVGSGSISTSYAVARNICNLAAGISVGGIVAQKSSSAVVSDSYWDESVAAYSSGSNCDTNSALGTPKSTTALMTTATFPSSWIENNWRMRDGFYPDLVALPIFN